MARTATINQSTQSTVLPEVLIINQPRGSQHTTAVGNAPSGSLYDPKNMGDNNFFEYKINIYRKRRNVFSSSSSDDEEIKITISKYALKPGSFNKKSPLGLSDGYPDVKSSGYVKRNDLGNSLYKEVKLVSYTSTVKSNSGQEYKLTKQTNVSSFFNVYEKLYSTNSSNMKYWVKLIFKKTVDKSKGINSIKITNPSSMVNGISLVRNDSLKDAKPTFVTGYTKKITLKNTNKFIGIDVFPNAKIYKKLEKKSVKTLGDLIPDKLDTILINKELQSKQSFSPKNARDEVDKKLISDNTTVHKQYTSADLIPDTTDSKLLATVKSTKNSYKVTTVYDPITISHSLGSEKVYPIANNNTDLPSENIYKNESFKSIKFEEFNVYDTGFKKKILEKENLYEKPSEKKVLKKENIYFK